MWKKWFFKFDLTLLAVSLKSQLLILPLYNFNIKSKGSFTKVVFSKIKFLVNLPGMLKLVLDSIGGHETSALKSEWTIEIYAIFRLSSDEFIRGNNYLCLYGGRWNPSLHLNFRKLNNKKCFQIDSIWYEIVQSVTRLEMHMQVSALRKWCLVLIFVTNDDKSLFIFESLAWALAFSHSCYWSVNLCYFPLKFTEAKETEVADNWHNDIGNGKYIIGSYAKYWFIWNKNW